MPPNRAAATVRGALLAGAVTVGATLGVTAGLLSSSAAAHVTITVSTTEAGAAAQVRLEVPHGCAGSATTELAVRMPDDVTEVVGETSERWAADVAGDAVTFRTDRPLPDGLRDEVAFSVRLPDDVGAVLVFPVVQRCETGESAWTEVAEDDASRDALEQPAPFIVVTGPGASSSPPPEETPDQRLMAYGAAGLLATGCLTSGVVLALRRRRA